MAQSPPASSTPTPSLPSVDVSPLTAKVKPVLDAMPKGRAMADIEVLAKTPRHPKENEAETRAAASYIEQQLSAAGLKPQQIPVELDGITLPVVWAEITGTSCADRVFVLTGHYDTEPGTPGADDDASGIAAMLETARVLAKAEPSASIVVAGLPFEEEGPPYPAARALGQHLQGSGKTIVGMLSAEMLGYALPEPTADDEGDYLMLLGYQGAETLVATFDAAAQAWTTSAKDWSGVEAGTYPPSTDFIARSDHAAFYNLGVPAAFATDGANFRTPHYHQPSDTPDNIVPDFFNGAVRTVVGGSYAMASLDSDSNGVAQACEALPPTR